MQRFIAPLAGSLTPIPPESWRHPAIDFQQDIDKPAIPTKLYLVPTLDRLAGEEFESDPDFAPVATSGEWKELHLSAGANNWIDRDQGD